MQSHQILYCCLCFPPYSSSSQKELSTLEDEANLPIEEVIRRMKADAEAAGDDDDDEEEEDDEDDDDDDDEDDAMKTRTTTTTRRRRRRRRATRRKRRSPRRRRRLNELAVPDRCRRATAIRPVIADS